MERLRRLYVRCRGSLNAHNLLCHQNMIRGTAGMPDRGPSVPPLLGKEGKDTCSAEVPRRRVLPDGRFIATHRALVMLRGHLRPPGQCNAFRGGGFPRNVAGLDFLGAGIWIFRPSTVVEWNRPVVSHAVSDSCKFLNFVAVNDRDVLCHGVGLQVVSRSPRFPRRVSWSRTDSPRSSPVALPPRLAQDRSATLAGA